MKIKKGDLVLITVGKDKGKQGKVEKVFLKRDRLLIPGLNVYKRHLKKRDEKTQGGIVEFSRPIPASNVAIICSKCNKPTRVSYSKTKTEKVRICKKCQQPL